ncbi:MAG TPA: hypothetical protein PK280_21060 [Planctomycetota bacterium]|nr:hypothetical protein [Planctomycetota bacterium]
MNAAGILSRLRHHADTRLLSVVAVVSLLSGLFLAAGCGPARPAPTARNYGGHRSEARKLADQYPVLTGVLASMMASGEVGDIVAAGKAEVRTYSRTKAGGEQEVTEHRLMDSVVRVSVRSLVCFDPVVGLDPAKVSEIAYGDGEKDGLVLTDAQDVKDLLDALREHSREVQFEIAWQGYRSEGETGPVRLGRHVELPSMPVTATIYRGDSIDEKWEPSGTRGLYIQVKPGWTLCFRGEAFGGRFTTGGTEPVSFVNPQVVEVLKRLAERGGKALAPMYPSGRAVNSEAEAIAHARKSSRCREVPADCPAEVVRSEGRYFVKFVKRITDPFPARVVQATVMVDEQTGVYFVDNRSGKAPLPFGDLLRE